MPFSSAVRTVTTAATRVRLSASSIQVSYVEIQAEADNIGNIYVGDGSVDNSYAPLAAGDRIRIPAPEAGGGPVSFDLTNIWLDSDNDGEGVNFWYNQS